MFHHCIPGFGTPQPQLMPINQQKIQWMKFPLKNIWNVRNLGSLNSDQLRSHRCGKLVVLDTSCEETSERKWSSNTYYVLWYSSCRKHTGSFRGGYMSNPVIAKITNYNPRRSCKISVSYGCVSLPEGNPKSGKQVFWARLTGGFCLAKKRHINAFTPDNGLSKKMSTFNICWIIFLSWRKGFPRNLIHTSKRIV